MDLDGVGARGHSGLPDGPDGLEGRPLLGGGRALVVPRLDAADAGLARDDGEGSLLREALAVGSSVGGDVDLASRRGAPLSPELLDHGLHVLADDVLEPGSPSHDEGDEEALLDRRGRRRERLVVPQPRTLQYHVRWRLVGNSSPQRQTMGASASGLLT